jgi:hypothetical protein
MVAKALLGASAIAVALCGAPAALGDPADRDTDVPGMNYNAVLGDPCFSWERYIFGRAPNGEPLACVTSDGDAGVWVASVPLAGGQEIGAPCTAGLAAQSPDGRPLICTGESGWLPGP